MKPTRRNPLLRNFVLAATSLLGLTSISYSADLFWDANGDTSTAVGGTGNWSATAWRADSTTGTLGAWVDGNRPVFATSVGIVTLDQNVAADGINFTVNSSEIRGSGTNTITFDGGTVTSGSANLDITALLAGNVIFNPTGGSLNTASTFYVKANNTGLTSVELNASGANPNMVIDDAGAFGSASSTVLLTAGILNIGALTTDGVGGTNGSGGGFNMNAWTTTLAGGTIRSRAGANTWNGSTSLTANSGLMTRGVAGISLTFSPTATIDLDSFTLTCSSDVSSDGIKLQGNISGVGGKIATGNFNGGGSINPGGSTILSGTNTYSGGTDVNFGSLVFLNAASKPSTGDVTVAAGSTLGLGVGASPTYFTATEIDALFAGTWSGVTLDATSNVGIDTTAGDFSYAGTTDSTITYGLAKLGANKLTLTGSNAYTGPTNVFGGTIALSGAGTFGSGALTLNGGTVDLGDQSINIGALSVVRAATSGETITAGSLTTSGTVANSYAASNASGNAVIAASLLENSTAGLTKTGAGTLTLSGANTYTGGTTVSAGGITFLKTAALPTTGTVAPLAASTVGLGVGASPTYFTNSDVISLLAGTLTNVNGTNAYTVGVDTSAGDYTLTDDLGASTRALTKMGANALTLSGDNTFNRLITVSEGTLKAGSATAFNNTGTLAVLPGATLDLNGNDARFVTMTNNTGTITTSAAGTGTDTLTISALNVVTAGLFTDGATRNLAVSLVGGTNNSFLSNTGNTFSGGMILGTNMRVPVPAGTVGTPGAIVSGTFGRGTVTINGNAQIWFNSNLEPRTLVNHVIVNGNAGNGGRSGSFRLQFSGLTITGNVTANNADAWFGSDAPADSTLNLNGQLTGPSGFRFYQSSGSNVWTAILNNLTANPNDYAGPTTINSAQTTLKLGAADQIPNGTDKGNVVLTSGTLDLNGFNETINGLSGAGTVDNVATGTANTLTLGDGDATASFTGVITNTTGELSLVKTGTGTQTLTGANTYAGTTTVNGGTLLVNGDQSGATGAVLVNEATLGGTGTIAGTVTITTQGTIAPGTDGTVEILYINDNTSIAGTFACDVNAATTDEIQVTGNLTLTGSTLAINEIAPPTPGTYVIASYTGTRTGTLGGTLPSGYSVNYNDINKEVELVIAAPAGYSAWAAVNAGGQTADLDFDNDGVSNGVEFFMGETGSGFTTSPTSFANKKATWTNGGNIPFGAYGTQFWIQTSTNLVNWTDVLAADPNLENLSGAVSYTLTGSGKEFMRLKVTPN